MRTKQAPAHRHRDQPGQIRSRLPSAAHGDGIHGPDALDGVSHPPGFAGEDQRGKDVISLKRACRTAAIVIGQRELDRFRDSSTWFHPRSSRSLVSLGLHFRDRRSLSLDFSPRRCRSGRLDCASIARTKWSAQVPDGESDDGCGDGVEVRQRHRPFEGGRAQRCRRSQATPVFTSEPCCPTLDAGNPRSRLMSQRRSRSVNRTSRFGQGQG